MNKERVGEQVMPRVSGKSFRCDCECNVFTVTGIGKGETTYKCNACGSTYIGEHSRPHHGEDKPKGDK